MVYNEETMNTNRKYTKNNVSEALDDRLKLIFEEFDNLLIQFNGDCNSGILLNAALDYKRKHSLHKKVAVLYIDYEAQYDKTTDYITRAFERNIQDIDPYWICVPLTVDFSIYNNKLMWVSWNPEYRDIWVRSIPNQPYIISFDNNNLPEFYTQSMPNEEFKDNFLNWYVDSHKGKNIILSSVTEGSTNSQIVKKCWITQKSENYSLGHPLYDFEYKDIWIMNSINRYDYNDMYNLLWKAKIPVSQLKIPCPHNVWNKTTLNCYRVIDPEMWARILGRIEGSNFGVFFSGVRDIEYLDVKLPSGDTWENYCAFLLSTLPREIRNGYIDKFKVSIRFWTEHGGIVPEKGIKELLNSKYPITLDGISKYSEYNKINVIFNSFPDNTDDIDATFQIPSWKRNTFCILISDYICQRMGFARTKKQTDFINWVLKRYNDPESFI